MQVTNVNEYVRIYAAKPRNSFGRMFEVRYIIYFRSKNWRILGLQVEQSKHIMLWRSLWDLLDLVVLLCVGDATAIYYLLVSFAKATKMEILNVKTFSSAEQSWCNSNLLFIQAALRKPPKWKYWTLKRSLKLLKIFHKIGVQYIK